MDDTNKIQMTREQVLEFRAMEAELSAARMAFENAQLRMQTTQANGAKVEAAHKAFVEKLSKEITDDGAYDIVTQDWNSGEIIRKLNDVGRARRADAEKAKAEATNGASTPD